MAQVNLGSIKFKWKGIYAGSTAYTIDDVVSYNGSSYICIQASTGNLPTDTTYFEQMSSAGTNGTDGTDVGTTITTQGDILYRDASGLQRLGAGTSGQVLQTGGTGANPSWGTVSSDFVKLASTSLGSDASYVSLDGYYDDTTYSHYQCEWKIRIANGSSTTDAHLNFRVNTTGNPNTATEYSGAFNHFGDNNAGSFNDIRQNSFTTGWGKRNELQISNTWNEHELYTTDDTWNRGLIKIYEPQTTSYYKQFTWENQIGSNGSSWTAGGVGHAIYHSTTATTGLSFHFQNGQNVRSGSTIILWGVKK
jgi:hypothetical protein